MSDFVCLAPATRVLLRAENQIQVGTTPFHTVLLTVPAGRAKKVQDALLRAHQPVKRISYLSKLATSLQCPRDSHEVALAWAHHIMKQLWDYKLLRPSSQTAGPLPSGIIARPILLKPLKRYFPAVPWVDPQSVERFAHSGSSRRAQPRCAQVLHSQPKEGQGLLVATDMLTPTVLFQLKKPYLPVSIREGYVTVGPAVDPTSEHRSHGCPLCRYLNDFPKPRRWTTYEEAFRWEPSIPSATLSALFGSMVKIQWQQFMLALQAESTDFSMGTVYLFDPVTFETKTREVKLNPDCPVCAHQDSGLVQIRQIDGSFLGLDNPILRTGQ